jgi:hypothetical protein
MVDTVFSQLVPHLPAAGATSKSDYRMKEQAREREREREGERREREKTKLRETRH